MTSGKLFSFISILTACMVGGMLPSCNKDDIISVDVPPRIIIDSETGIYEIKAGCELTIAPRYENISDATFTWEVDDIVSCTGPVFTLTWEEPGQYYVTLTVTTPRGSASEELRVDVLERCIPYISFPFTCNEFSIKVGTEYMLTPEIAFSTPEDPVITIDWMIDGKAFASGRTLRFTAETTGDYAVTITATNAEGSDEKSFTLHVVDQLPYTLEFPRQSYFMNSTTRYTFVGRKVILKPLIEGLDVVSYEWSVNGSATDCDTPTFAFTPETEGQYVINLTVNGDAGASVIVECVSGNEDSRMRKATNSSSTKATEVFEWVPAPGQFIGDNLTGGMTGNETTHEAAVKWALERLNNQQYVSLGAFGGYIIVGFDHSIENNETSYDFSISGNAFFNLSTGDGGSNEPGIVYVSQDVNGNGLPDDEWYELRGSETGKAETLADYCVTYYRPPAPKMNVQLSDCLGNNGTIDYLQAFHRQDYYYPAWIVEDSYTLRGTRLKDRTTQNSETGMWDNNSFAWGYSDNMGSDVLSSNDSGGGEGQRNGFLIKNAMYSTGEHINLQYIDFIKVQTGINCKAGWLGEVSTEVFGFEDLNISNQ